MIDRRIVDFIAKHHVLTLATAVVAGDGVVEAYCSNMFYAYDKSNNRFVFSSDDHTRHVADIEKNPFIAGSIVLETKVVGKVQGIQFQGRIRRLDESDGQAKKEYFKRFPYALAIPTQLWVVEPTFMKLTDNRLGFGTKLVWREGEEQNNDTKR